MIVVRYISILLVCYIQSICIEATCTSPRNLSNTYDGVFYEVRDNTETCTFNFIASPDGPNHMLIINIWHISSYKGNSKITLPGGEKLVENDWSNGNSICRRYLLTEDETHTCTNETFKQSCETDIKNAFNIDPLNITSFHDDTLGLTDYLQLNFTYLFLDCPPKIIGDLSTQSPFTTRNVFDNATTPSNNYMTIIVDGASPDYKTTTADKSEIISSNMTEDTTKNANAPLTNSHEQDQHNMLMMIVIILLVAVLAISCIVIVILGIKLHGGKAKKSRDKHKDSGDSEPAESNPQDIQQARDGQIRVNGSSTSEEATIYLQPLQPIYSIAE